MRVPFVVNLIVIPRDDDVTFGILSSSVHVAWAVRAGGRLGVGNDSRYNSTLCFEKFPFPETMTPSTIVTSFAGNAKAEQIAIAARKLVEARDRWLNPPEWTERLPESVQGYPDRIMPKEGCEARLKKRTLTNLYNEMPDWLKNLQRNLDAAVAAAYGWSWPLSDDEIRTHLFALNKQRSTPLDPLLKRA